MDDLPSTSWILSQQDFFVVEEDIYMAEDTSVI